MNKEQRLRIEAVEKMVAEVQPRIAKAIEVVGEVKEENEQSFDNMSEGLQESENGQKMTQAVDALTEAESSLETIASELDSLEGYLNDAKGE